MKKEEYEIYKKIPNEDKFMYMMKRFDEILENQKTILKNLESNSNE